MKPNLKILSGLNITGYVMFQLILINIELFKIIFSDNFLGCFGWLSETNTNKPNNIIINRLLLLIYGTKM